MTLQQFIREHRKELDEHIAQAMGRTVDEIPHRNDDERRLWILNDDGLYQWARSEGCRV